MKKHEKDPAAVALGRRGGQARVPKGFASLSPEERSAAASAAAYARWGTKRAKTKAKAKKVKP